MTPEAPMSAVAVLATVVATLASVTGILGKRLLKEADDCKKDRQALWQRLAMLQHKSCSDSTCGDRQPIELVTHSE